MSFSHLFKDKYDSHIICEYLEKLIREMSDLKRENYYTQEKIDERNIKIKDIEKALTQLNIPIDNVFEEVDEDDYR